MLFCFSTSSAGAVVSAQACEQTQGCANSIWLCEHCRTLRSPVPCAYCWAEHLERCCVGCGGALDLAGVQQCRLCAECAGAVIKHAHCFACGALGLFETVRCGAAETCERRVRLCDMCKTWSPRIACDRCWKSSSAGKCYICRTVPPRYDHFSVCARPVTTAIPSSRISIDANTAIRREKGFTYGHVRFRKALVPERR